MAKRDYDLLGPDGRRAVETGLAAAEWYHTDVPRKVMKDLMQRSDAPAIRDTVILYGVMILTAGIGIWLWPSWWSAPFWAVYGVLYGSASDSRWHECGHGTAFKTPWMNRGVGNLELITQKLSKTDPKIVKKLIDDGLVKYDKGAYYKYVPLWSAQTNIIREQIFPANKSVEVIHTYKPLAGGSVGGGLSKEYRQSKDSYFVEFSQKKYCIDKQFLDAFDKHENKNKVQDTETMEFYSETWLGYVLSSGANWKGPIKDFRLVVDKGAPDKLISFCMTGVKKISPTQFEVRKKNFEPKNDLNILIVNWSKP